MTREPFFEEPDDWIQQTPWQRSAAPPEGLWTRIEREARRRRRSRLVLTRLAAAGLGALALSLALGAVPRDGGTSPPAVAVGLRPLIEQLPDLFADGPAGEAARTQPEQLIEHLAAR